MTGTAHAQSPTASVELKPAAGRNMIQVTGTPSRWMQSAAWIFIDPAP